MPFRDQRSSPSGTRRSKFDRKAINAACHVLLGMVWMERRVAMDLVTLAEKTDARRAARRPRPALIAAVINES
jgi:hypothetical protein